MLFVISVTHIPPAVHRTPHRSSTDTAPRTALLGTLVRLRRTRVGMHSGQRPAHGHPLLFMGIRGRNEARTLKRPWSDYCFSSSRLRNSGCRGGVPPHGVQVVGRTVRASKQQPIQFKKLSQTIRPFICECMLDYRALECWLR